MLDVLAKEINLSQEHFGKIRDLVYSHCGISLSQDKKELVRSRLSKRLRQMKMDSFSQYVSYICKNENSDEFSNMIDLICTNLTSFFRERTHFNFLEKVLFDKIIHTKKSSPNKKIRLWSAGCSSGEEPYSLAITLNEKFESLAHWDIKILASDVSYRILDRAKTGIYDPKRVEPLTPEIKSKYLTRINHDGQNLFQVKPAIRDMITFAYINLMEPFPFRGPLDIIFCRNVMIYFDKQTQEKLISKFWKVLGTGGVLFTGHSESLTGIQHKFKYIQPTIYQKD